MKVTDVYGSGNSLKAEDIGKENATMDVTVKSVTSYEFQDGKKLILNFEETNKDLILNKTNANNMAKIAESEESEDWKGQKIQLKVKSVDFKGEEVPAIRIRERTGEEKQEGLE